MSLTGTITAPSGVDATYHVITRILVRPPQHDVVLTMESYTDQAAYDAGKEPLRSKRFTVADQAFDNYYVRSQVKPQGLDHVGQGEQYIVDNTDLTKA